MSRLKTLIKRVNASQIPDKHMMASALEKCAGDAGRKAHISAMNETLLAFGAMRLKGEREQELSNRLRSGREVNPFDLIKPFLDRQGLLKFRETSCELSE